MTECTLFIQTQGNPRIVEVAVPETVTEAELYQALEGAGALGTGECFVFVDEAEQHIERHENRRANGIIHGARVHVARCHRIRTTVHYLERTIERSFSPGARLRSVKLWAVREFHLDHKDAAEHVLQICNSRERPAPDTPLHVLVPPGDCTLCFDLVPEKRVEGTND